MVFCPSSGTPDLADFENTDGPVVSRAVRGIEE
jgi:hypothetical protein